MPIISTEELFGQSSPRTISTEELFSQPTTRKSNFLASLGKGAYEATPFAKRIGRLADIAKYELTGKEEPSAEQIYGAIEPETLPEKLASATGSALPMLAMANPFFRVASKIPFIGRSAILSTGAGMGGYEGAKALVRREPVLPAAGKGFGSGAIFGAAGKAGATLIPKFIPGAERIGSALGFGGASATMAPEEDKLTEAIFGTGMGSLMPFKRNEGLIRDVSRTTEIPEKIGKGTVRALIPYESVTERGLREGFKPMLKPEYYEERIPQDIMKKGINFFDDARKVSGKEISDIVKTNYNDVYVDAKLLQDEASNILGKGIKLADLDISPAQRKLLQRETSKILGIKGEVFPRGLTEKQMIQSFRKEKPLSISNLWEIRKNLDKVIYNTGFSWKPDALSYLKKLRSILNNPIRNAGDDIAESFNKFSNIENIYDEIGKSFEGIVNRQTGEVSSPKFATFLQTLMSDNPKAVEVRNMMSQINPTLAEKLFDIASAKRLGLPVKDPLQGGFFQASIYPFKRLLHPKNVATAASKVQDFTGRFGRFRNPNEPIKGGRIPFKSLGAAGDFESDVVLLNKFPNGQFTVRTVSGQKETITKKPGENIFLTPMSKEGKISYQLHDGDILDISKNVAEDLKGKFAQKEINLKPEEGVEEVVKKDRVIKLEETLKFKQEAIDYVIERAKLDLKDKAIDKTEYNDIMRHPEDYAQQYQDMRAEETMNTKFSQYQLPGGENYREVLIKAPIKQELSEEVISDLMKEYKLSRKQVIDNVKSGDLQLSAEDKKAIEKQSSFTSSHWDEPNVLTHIRMNDRTTPDGKKVLFLEEIQSDWASKARKLGQGTELPEGLSIRKVTQEDIKNWHLSKQELGHWQVYNETDSPQLEEPISGFLSRQEAIDRAKPIISQWEGVRVQDWEQAPSHPLLKDWQELALKRAVKEAVEKDYDYISWTTGEQQAERYDLSKQVDNIQYVKRPKAEVGMYDINIIMSNKDKIHKTLSEKELPDFIGKEAAQKVIEGKGSLTGETTVHKATGEERKVKMLTGVDLKIGGEWAKNLYDKQIPNILKDLTRGEIKTIDLSTKVPLTFVKEDMSAGELATFKKGGKLIQPALKITSEMKASIKGVK